MFDIFIVVILCFILAMTVLIYFDQLKLGNIQARGLHDIYENQVKIFDEIVEGKDD